MLERNGLYLVVWNKRFKGFGFPGGKLEGTETLFAGNARELKEETGLFVLKQTLVYQAWSLPEHGGVQVSIHEVVALGEPYEAEAGCPVAWFGEAQLCADSPFKAFYTRMFAALHALGRHRFEVE